jgi:hypothetical protein
VNHKLGHRIDRWGIRRWRHDSLRQRFALDEAAQVEIESKIEAK